MAKNRNQLPKEWRQEQARKQQALQEAAAVARLNKEERFYDRLVRCGVNPKQFYSAGVEWSPWQVVDVSGVNQLVSYPDFDMGGDGADIESIWGKWVRQHGSLVRLPFDNMFLEWRIDFVKWPGTVYHGIFLSGYVDVSESVIDCTWVCDVEPPADEPPEAHIDITPVSQQIIIRNNQPQLPTARTFQDLYPAQEFGIVMGHLMTAFTAIGIMNCKNVQLVDHPMNPVVAGKYERRYGQPLTRYKVLTITPMRRASKHVDGSLNDNPALPKALHIVRGHFADYRNGNGLFGKYKDIFWIDAHVRGDEKQGVVVKDYDVRPDAS